MGPDDISDLRARLSVASSDEERLRSLLELSDRLVRIDFHESLALASEAFAIATRLGDPSGIAISPRLKGQANEHLGNLPLALELSKESLKYFEQSGDVREAINASQTVANIYADLADYASSLEEHYRLESLIREHAPPKIEASFHNNFGLLWMEIGDFQRALEHLQRALEISEKHGFDILVAAAVGNIGKALFALGRPQEALQRFQRARMLSETIGYRRGVSIWSMSIGDIYRDLRELTDALSEYHRAQSIAEELGDRQNYASATGSIGMAHRELGNYTAAMDHLLQALTTAEDGGFMRQVAITCRAIGMIYANRAYEGYDPDIGETFLLRAARLHIDSGDRDHLWRAYESLTELYRDHGKLQQAFDYQRLHFQIKEEVLNLEAHIKAQRLENRRQIAEMETQRAVEQKEAELERLKSKQIEKQLNNTTLQLLAQTELLRDLRSDLQRIIRKIPPTEPVGRELRDRIKNLLCESVDWKKFDRQFEAAHPEFIRKLTERAADLTPTEVRVCTMVRMNLKSHEIASLFCITEEGVEFHRKNIRRKLGLRKEEKLPIVLGGM